MEKFEFLRGSLEVGSILTFDEMDLIIKTLEINKERIIEKKLNIDSMIEYAEDKKYNARLNGDYDTFDSYYNALSKILATVQYVIFHK